MKQLPGPRFNIGTVFPGMVILMLKIRRSRDRLIFNMGIPILVRRHLYIETDPSFSSMIPGEWFLRHAFCNTINHRRKCKQQRNPLLENKSNDGISNPDNHHSVPEPIAAPAQPGAFPSKVRIQWPRGNQSSAWARLDQELSTTLTAKQLSAFCEIVHSLCIEKFGEEVKRTKSDGLKQPGSGPKSERAPQHDKIALLPLSFLTHTPPHPNPTLPPPSPSLPPPPPSLSPRVHTEHPVALAPHSDITRWLKLLAALECGVPPVAAETT